MKTTIYEMNEMAESRVVATYTSKPIDALIDYVITYVLHQPSLLLDKEKRESVRMDLRSGKAHWMYFADNGNVYLTNNFK